MWWGSLLIRAGLTPRRERIVAIGALIFDRAICSMNDELTWRVRFRDFHAGVDRIGFERVRGQNLSFVLDLPVATARNYLVSLACRLNHPLSNLPASALDRLGLPHTEGVLRRRV